MTDSTPHQRHDRHDRHDRLRESYDRMHPRLWRAVRAWSGSREVADEAAAEAYAQAARRLDAIRDVDAWVWRAAFRIAAGELQRRRRRPTPAGDALDVLAARGRVADLHDDMPEVAMDLVRALQKLTEQQRACVVLRDVAGMPAPEIAAALNTSPGTVRVQLFRSRRVLRNLLENDDV